MARQTKALPGSLTFKQYAFSVGTASSEAVKHNNKRRYLLIQNISDEPIYIRVGSAASTTNGIMLAPGYDATNGRDYQAMSSIEFIADRNLTVDAIYAACGVSGNSLMILEGANTGENVADATGGTGGVSSSSSSSSSSSPSSASSESSSSPSSESSSSPSSASSKSSSSSSLGVSSSSSSSSP